MKRRILACTAFAAAFLTCSAPAFAHHGEAEYDSSKLVTVKGTISNLRFANPHVRIVVEVKDDAGAVQEWVGEAASPNMLVREGFNKNALKVGDSIVATGYPAKKGTNVILLKKLVFANGQEFSPRPYWGS
jgi:hypothetical protein